jgi:hypothetical protein
MIERAIPAAMMKKAFISFTPVQVFRCLVLINVSSAVATVNTKNKIISFCHCMTLPTTMIYLVDGCT